MECNHVASYQALLYLCTHEYSTLTHRGEGEPGKEPRMATDDLYRFILHNYALYYMTVGKGHHGPRVGTVWALSLLYASGRIFTRVNDKGVHPIFILFFE